MGSRQTRSLSISVAACGLLALFLQAGSAWGAEPVRYCRFQKGDTVAYGVMEGDNVRQLDGDLFGKRAKTTGLHRLDEVKLLVPTQPTQVLAMAGNYRSHLGRDVVTTVTTVTKLRTDVSTHKTQTASDTKIESYAPGEVPPKFAIPQPFFKSPSCLIPTGEAIVIPRDATTVHYEGELVIVIGRTAKKVAKEAALDYVLGVTCGVDVSERVWQANDVQWWRAKGADTFGPCGPFIAAGIDYDNLLLQLRVNGEVKQKERTSEFIHDVRTMVSNISQYITLHPGDLIFTGTSGETSDIKAGDVVEVEIEGIGVLRNPVEAEK